MKLTFYTYRKADILEMMDIWNDILEDGVAFPGTELYDLDRFEAMLGEQTAATCLAVDGRLAGYYILHPNNIGRCGHVANASYAMKKEFRGKGLGKYLVCPAPWRRRGNWDFAACSSTRWSRGTRRRCGSTARRDSRRWG